MRPSRRQFLAASLAFAANGCAMLEIGVTNPVVGLSTVAIVPFFNLSQEPNVDGRRFAMAYFAELQKTPGFQVLPVGVVEQAIFDHKLAMGSPEDALKLAKILKVDAVVLGGVTDYSAYYPPRIGLQVSWYSPYQWSFFPGPLTDDFARDSMNPPKRFGDGFRGMFAGWRSRPEYAEGYDSSGMYYEGNTRDGRNGNLSGSTCRGQSPSEDEASSEERWSWPKWEWRLWGEKNDNDDATRLEASEELRTADGKSRSRSSEPLAEVPSPPQEILEELTVEVEKTPPADQKTLSGGNKPQSPTTFDPTEPFMSYTRLFDGADPRLTARLRDYVELSGDLRSGGWKAYLQRSEDFLRFTSHVMVVEMIQVHGGEARRRFVFKKRKYK